MPSRCRISSANNADPTGAPNSSANAAAMPAIVMLPRFDDREPLPAREPRRQRSARRHQRRLGAGRRARRDRDHRHRHERPQLAHAFHTARNVDVVDEQFHIARLAEHARHDNDHNTGERQRQKRDGHVVVIGPQHVLQQVNREQVQRADDAAREADANRGQKKRGRHPEHAPIEQHIVVRYTCAERCRISTPARVPHEPAPVSSLERTAGPRGRAHTSATPTPAGDPWSRRSARPDDSRRRRVAAAPAQQRSRPRRPRGRRRSDHAPRRRRRSSGCSSTTDDRGRAQTPLR